ncbi:amino acid adenylation domain-containing protein, partial [uncultured Nisaea sp.]|uniref:amino acid adenylation domain-containing protein n=1 Tax=uncultured Nisaea sp. TaxID=538215 RepID=UPI0030ECEA93
MTIAEFVRTLAERQVELSVTEGQIRYHGPSGAIDEDVLTQIRDRKSDLIAYLNRAPEMPDHTAEPLSLGQEALWFLYELDRTSIAYNTLFAARLGRDLDMRALQAALDKLTERHQGLRSRFGSHNGKPFSIPSAPAPLDLPVTDVSGWSTAEVESAIAEFADQPFDLEAAPPVRWHLFSGVSNGTLPTPVLAFVAHHIVVDFRSLEIIMSDLSSLYRAEREGRAAALPALPWTNRAYAEWSRETLATPAGKRSGSYWLDRLGGELPVLDLPTDRQRPPRQDFTGATITRDLDPALSARLKETAQRLGVTPYVLLLGTFGLLLNRYSGQREILIGSPMLGRTRPELKDLVGYFVNPAILRLDFPKNREGTDFLAHVRETVLGALEHQDYPFPLLVERLQPQRDPSRSPLFQVAFVHEREAGTPLVEQGLFSDMLAGGQRGAVFDLTLTALDRTDGYRLTWEYACALFERDTVDRMSGHFEHLLSALLDNTDQPLDTIPLLSEAEAARIRGWNETDAPVPPARNLVDLIAAQVAERPDAIALDTGAAQISYAGLDARACRLARHLQERGIGTNDIVAIALPRSAEQLIAVLGVLRSGAACLPVDPQDPPERIGFILRESGAALVLTDPASAERMPGDGPAIIALSPDDPLLTKGDATPPECPAAPEDRIYVLFTSGSTGRPKGVEMPHRAIVNLVAWQARQPGLDQPARTLQYTALTFDVSFQEIASTWCSGGTLVLVDEDCRRDGRALLDWIESRNVERVFMPFVALQHLAESTGNKAFPDCLRDIVTAGEQLRGTPAIRAAFGRSACRLHNHYGPTESHVATAYRLPEDVTNWDDLPPIGRPIGNVKIHLLDETGQPVPPGVPGELCIAGPCIAHGYMAQPDLTHERFSEHPEYGRIYRTGDFARWRPDGLIDYIGRRDDQVKIRGVRVELGEIEAVLSGHPAVTEAAIIVYGHASARRLAAYVATTGEQADPKSLQSDLMAHLRAALPAPMVPSSLTLLAQLPKTSSGKLDRRALAEPSVTLSEESVAPRNQDEELLTGIWSELLGHDRIGVTDDFFELGGHSLIAMRLVTRLRDSFDVDLPLSALFEAPTIAGLAERIDQLRGGDRLPPITSAPDAQTSPLSFAQRRLWFLEQLEGPSATYNMPATLELRGVLDEKALGRAARALIERQTSLRSCFPSRAGEPVAELVAPYDPLKVTDLSTLPADARMPEAERLSRSHGAQPFDLSEGPLFRLHLLRFDDRTHWLLFNIHHIISDGWTIDILVRDFAALYRAETHGDQGMAASLPDLTITSGDFARWQNDWFQGETLSHELDHWIAELDGAPTLLELPADRPHPKTRSYRGGLVTRALDPALAAKLRAFNRAESATDFMTLISAFGLLLSRYSDQHDLLIGSPVANRRLRECEDLAGMFVNILTLRWRDEDLPDFSALVAETRRRCLRAYANQDLPFELLVDHLHPERSLVHSPLFQVMFVMQNAPMERLVFDGTEARPLAPPVAVSKFDLTLYVEPDGDGFVTRWEYNADIFDEARIARMAGHFEQLLGAAISRPHLALGDLGLITGPERSALTHWRDGASTDLSWDTLIDAIEAQAAQRPDAPALVDRRESLDFDMVNRSANQLAHYLQRHGISRGDIVGMCLEPGPEAVVSLLGIVKAGAAYLPLDPAYPPGRLDAMITRSGASLVLSKGDLADRLPETARICRLDQLAATLAEESVENPATRPAPDDLLYVIYTSGSTGEPKGAGVYHKGFVNLLQWYCRALDLGEDDRGLLISALGFDLTQKNLFAPLMAGAALHFPETGHGYDPAALRREIAEGAITWINCTPSAFYPLAAGDDHAPLASLRHVVLGGEPIQAGRLRPWLASANCQATVLNSYGPTECTDVAVAGPFDPASDAAGVPLGRPIDNVRVLVLDPNHAPVPVGMPGELFIGGIGVGAGYLGRPDLTAARFIELTEDGHTGRYYATGDVVQWQDDGTLDYIGRRDQQIKLRGFRIELEEIEAALRAQPAVEDAAVVVSKAGSHEHLVGYVTGGQQSDPEELRPALERSLPAYMVPDRLIRLDGLPVTPNGKLDRLALSNLAFTPRPAQPPRGQTETILAEIWAGLLGLDAIDRDASFFSIGGHSLLAVQLMARIADVFGTGLSLRALFEKPTLAGLASSIDAGRNRTRPDISALPPGTTPEPSFAQQRLMFLDQLEGASASYNVPAALDLKGALDKPALRKALAALVTRHDSLRLCFAFDDGKPVARLLEAYDPLTERDLGDLPEADAQAEAERLSEEHAHTPFDLAQGPLFRLHLITLGPDRHRLLFNMHHIICDGWSIDLLIADLARLYAAFRTGSDAAFPGPALNYTGYARWQNAWLKGDALEQELAFWRDRLAGAPELLDLPTDHPRPAVQVHEGGSAPVRVDADLAHALRTLARESDATLFMVLLAAYDLLLFRFCGMRDICVGVPVANRSDSRLEDIVGLFLNTLVMRAKVPESGSFRDFLASIRQGTLSAYAHQDVPFEYLVEDLHPARSLSHNPLFQVMINLVNTRREQIALDGLEVEQVSPARDFLVKFDLNLTFTELPDGALDGALQYNAALFEHETAIFLRDCFLTLLRGIVAQPDALLTDLSLYNEDPARRPDMPCPAGEPVRFGSIERSIQSRFADQVARYRDRIAIRTPSQSLTYGALDRESRRLAAALLEHSGSARIALLLPHDTRMAIGMLGVLQAGCAYVPLDPSQPPQRLRTILDDVGADMIVCAEPHEDLAGMLAGPDRAILHLDHLDLPPAGTLPEISPDSVAYLLYTSGSTGRPKGVVQSHRNVLHFIRRYTENLRLTPEDRLLQLASYAFDASVMDFYGALLNGATLCLFDARTRSVADSAPWLESEAVTVWHSTPSVFRAFTDGLDRRLPTIRLVVMGGEAVTRADFEIFRGGFEPGALFVNGLGPTESTVTLQYFATHNTDLRRFSVPVGHAVDGTGIELLDDTGTRTDLFGEIAICSPHVALGYWQQDSSAFEPDPTRPGAIRYRSGDMARRLPDGSLEVVGRRDGQIKLRGFRIELGEIEATLRDHPDIRQAAAVLWAPEDTPSQARLVAYIVGEATIENTHLWCRERLPGYMVPSEIIVLEALPLTVTGKLDRRALPEPSGSEQAASGAPATPGEELLAGLWASVLKRDAIGRADSFFDLGGHSLLATQLLSRIRTAFGTNIALRLLFEHPTLAAQAAAIEAERRGTPPPPIVPRENRGTLPLSFAQQRLWFLAQLEGSAAPDGVQS